MVSARRRAQPGWSAEWPGEGTVSALAPTKPHRNGDLQGLPLARLSNLKAASIHYALSVVDCDGRCADRSLLRLLRWGSRYRLKFTIDNRVIKVVCDPAGSYVTTRQGHLRFPADVRRRTGIEVGSRVLLAGFPSMQVLIAYPSVVLDAVIGSRWPLVDGERG